MSRSLILSIEISHFLLTVRLKRVKHWLGRDNFVDVTKHCHFWVPFPILECLNLESTDSKCISCSLPVGVALRWMTCRGRSPLGRLHMTKHQAQMDQPSGDCMQTSCTKPTTTLSQGWCNARKRQLRQSAQKQLIDNGTSTRNCNRYLFSPPLLWYPTLGSSLMRDFSYQAVDKKVCTPHGICCVGGHIYPLQRKDTL